jgi:hypothetical protein
MTDESGVGTADTMRARADDNGPALWLLMRADRLLVAGGLTLVAFVGFVVAVDAIVPSFVARVESSDPIETTFSTMIAVVVTGTTLVVTIGQFVLTQENGPLGDQRGHMDGAMTFRQDAETVLGAPVPADPSAFLGDLIAATADRSRTFESRPTAPAPTPTSGWTSTRSPRASPGTPTTCPDGSTARSSAASTCCSPPSISTMGRRSPGSNASSTPTTTPSPPANATCWTN